MTTTTTNTTPDALDALANQAAAVDDELNSLGAPGAPAAAPETKPQIGEQVTAMVHLGVVMLTPAMPFLPACYTPDACQRIGTAFEAVAEKRGWNLDEVMTPELALVLVMLPPTIQAVIAGKKHFDKPPLPKVEADGATTAHDGPAYPQEGVRVMSSGRYGRAP